MRRQPGHRRREISSAPGQVGEDEIGGPGPEGRARFQPTQHTTARGSVVQRRTAVGRRPRRRGRCRWPVSRGGAGPAAAAIASTPRAMPTSTTVRPATSTEAEGAEAQPGRGVMPGAEPHRRLDDNQSAGRSAIAWPGRPRVGPPRGASGDGGERLLAARHPVVIGQVPPALDPPDPRSNGGGAALPRRARSASSRKPSPPVERCRRRRRPAPMWRIPQAARRAGCGVEVLDGQRRHIRRARAIQQALELAGRVGGGGAHRNRRRPAPRLIQRCP